MNLDMVGLFRVGQQQFRGLVRTSTMHTDDCVTPFGFDTFTIWGANRLGSLKGTCTATSAGSPFDFAEFMVDMDCRATITSTVTSGSATDVLPMLVTLEAEELPDHCDLGSPCEGPQGSGYHLVGTYVRA